MADKTQQKVSTTQDSEEALTGRLPYTLTNDFFFKAFLQRNEIALRGLLCAILSMKKEEIQMLAEKNETIPVLIVQCFWNRKTEDLLNAFMVIPNLIALFVLQRYLPKGH